MGETKNIIMYVCGSQGHEMTLENGHRIGHQEISLRYCSAARLFTFSRNKSYFCMFISFAGAYFVIFSYVPCFEKVFGLSSHLPSFFGTSVVSSLVTANPTRTSRFCRSISKILGFKPYALLLLTITTLRFGIAYRKD